MITDLVSSFLLGLATPLTAVCVLPLYPAFLSFLSNQFSDQTSKKQYAMLGLIITSGVVLFMLVLGLLFTTLLQKSLTKIIGIVSPIAFGILLIISLFLIFDFDFSKIFRKKFQVPTSKNPLKNAFLYGFFFGAIVIPCNPAFIGAFLARSVLVTDFASSILNFLFFGIGLGFPLLIFSLISSGASSKIIGWATRNKTWINRIAGIVMLGISLYYLIAVFGIFG